MTQKICWITGASSGIGFATARQLARSGYIVAASARSADKLEKLAALDCGPGRIIAYPLDVTDKEAVHRTVNRIVSDHGRLDMAILCAGTYTPEHLDTWKTEDIAAQFDLNVMGTVYAVDALIPVMKKKSGCQLAIVSSVAGYRGLPRSIGYGGTKAALINMAEAMKPECDQLGIKLQLICPGFVKTELTDKNTFKMPFLISAEEAAKIIEQGLQGANFEIVFPRPMKLVMKIMQFLPYRLYFWLTRKLIA